MLMQFQNKTRKTPRRLLGQAAWQCGVIFFLAISLGASVNHFRNNGLPLFAHRSMGASLKTPSGARLDISLIDAKKLFLQHAAVFIDARSKEDFEKAHVKGAKSLPWHDVDRKFIAVTENIPDSATIITYCDGESCELSHHLANFLIDAGFNHVRVLVNGWTKWRDAHLPVEKRDDQ
jgi:rhodanese-related sulfurtransferase